MHYDATEEFASRLNDPTKWVTRPGVPIFKPHRRVDPNTGREIVVDVPKLYRIAENLQRMERQGGVPIRMTLGHTEPGKPETEQPPVAGYYRNARVQPFGPKGEPAVVVDEWLDPAYKGHRKNFPYRSSEYYDDTEQITGVALLTRDPYLDLGVVAYEGATMPVKGPVLYSAAGQPRTAYQFLLGDPIQYGHSLTNPGTNMYPYPYAGQFDESKHPRDKGKFAPKGSAQSGGGTDESAPSGGGRPSRQNTSRLRGSDAAKAAGQKYLQEDLGWSQGQIKDMIQDPKVPGTYLLLADNGQGGEFGLLVQDGQVTDELEAEDFHRNKPRRYSHYSRGDAPMWPYGYDANGQPLPAPQAPTVPPIPTAQAAPVYPTPYQSPHVHTGYGLPTAPPQVQPVAAPRGPAPVGYAQPQPVPYGQQPSGAPFHGGYTQSPAAMSHSSDWQFRSPNANARYADQIPGQHPVHELTGPGVPPHEGANAPEEDDEAGLNALHHHMSQAVEHLSRYMQAGRGRRSAYAGSDEIRGSNQAGQIRAMWAKDPVDPTHDTYGRAPSPGFPQGQGTADSPYARNAGRYEGERLPVAYQLELDKLQAKVRAMEESQKVVMYERDQADTAACESEIRRLASQGYAVDANDVVKLKRTPLDQRPAFINEIMTKYSRVGTEALPPIMGDPSPMHDVGPVPNGGRATREQMMAALRATPADAPPDMYAQALQSVQYGGPQAQFGTNGEVQGPGNPFGDPYGT